MSQPDGKATRDGTTRWRQHSTFDETKVTMDVGVTRLRDELGMTLG